ncbi:MAG: cobalamin-dependent protein [Candidatus Omnitrophica bacterium]|nr:cobalamin-dependent protein [Candidatus Omnitrophota bacterium]
MAEMNKENIKQTQPVPGTTAVKRKLIRMVVPAYAAFNIYSAVANKTTALGPVALATVINKMDEWDVEIIDENNLRLYGPKGFPRGADHEFIQKIRPADMVGLYGGLTSTIPRLYEIAKFYKSQGVFVMAGGQHFADDNIEEALRSNIDLVCTGEGEDTVREFLTAYAQNKDYKNIKGLAFLQNNKLVINPEREQIQDLDRLPLPDFSLVRYAKITLYPIGRIRGCGMDCEFCTVKGKPRCASPEHFMENIRHLVETRDAKHFFMVDDLFGQYRNETIRFCNMLRDYQLSIGKRLDFTAQIRLDKAKDTELLTAMREAAINAVAIGFESPIEEELIAMKKQIRPQDMVNLARIYHKFGFLVHGMFIFGYPPKEGVEKTNMSMEERVKRFKKFFRDAKIDTVQVLLPVPLPGTELRDRLVKQGRVYPLEQIGWEYYDGNFPIFEPDPPITAEELHLAVRKIMGHFYQYKSVLWVILHTFSLPHIVFFFHHFKKGWASWKRRWKHSLLRMGGWGILSNWIAEFNKNPFSEKLTKAKQALKK